MATPKTATSEYIDNLSSAVKKKLPDYLAMNGISVEKNGTFRCVNPESHKNGDKNPAASMTEQPSGEYIWHCFACHKGGDIYHAAQSIEGLSFDGPSFVPTVVYLAEKLGIPVEHSKIPTSNPETVIRTEIYKEIVQYIINEGNGVECLTSGRFGRYYGLEEAEEVLKLCAFGTVEPIAFNAHLKTKFTDDKLRLVPFYRQTDAGYMMDPDIFNTDVMSFPLMTSYGQPIGFCGRMTDEKCNQLKAEGKKVDKYKNSYGSAQYKKYHPFLMYETQKHISITKRALIVEGQFDAITAFIKGYPYVVPLMGSSLSQELMDVITRKGIYEIIFALDADKAGIAGLRRALEITKLYKVTPTVVCLPSDSDPDELLLANKDLFDKLYTERRDAVAFLLEHDAELNDPDLPKDIRLHKMIEYVCEYTSMHSKMRDYARVIARTTGEEESDVFEDMKNFSLGQETRNTEVERAWQKIEDARYRTFQEKTAVIISAQDTIRRVSTQKEEHLLQKSWMDLRSLASGQSKLPTRLLTGVPLLDEYARLECGTFNALCGWPSNGKSSVIRSLMVDMVAQNPSLVVLYVSTDDHPKKTLIDTTALLTNIPKDKIRGSLDAMTFTEDPEIRKYLDLLQQMYTSRIIILGQEDVGSVLQIRKKSDIIQAQCPGSNILVVVDALNNLTDVTNPKRGMDQRTGLEFATRELKNMAASTDNVATIALLHLGKEEWRPGLRPTLGKIKGSGFMEYEAKVVLFSYIDAHYNKDSELLWRSPFGKMAPVLELNVAKDKDREANRMIPLHFEPLVGKILQPRKEEMEKYAMKTGGKYAQDTNQGGDMDNRF